MQYEKDMVSQSRLYNGTGYRDYLATGDEHPFLIEDWEDGSILYDGELFPGVALMYDIRDDKVIIEHYTSREKIQLIANKVSWFTLKERSFVNLNILSKKGFYEVLYDGPTKVYVKWEKFYWEQINQNSIDRYFTFKTNCYIYKENTFYPVKSKQDELKALVEHKSELNQFIKKNNLDFRVNREKNEYKSNREKNIARVAEYYDSLIK